MIALRLGPHENRPWQGLAEKVIAAINLQVVAILTLVENDIKGIIGTIQTHYKQKQTSSSNFKKPIFQAKSDSMLTKSSYGVQ